jgi:alpha-amylase/alpha-mannosidase (GH57 family)
MNRFVCIHGHFYQPPRENPWLEEIEIQDSAHPYHDWNERITAECYGPNAAARILGDERRIADIVNNYSRMSFNFGPTLLSWMERRAPEVYAAVLEADRESRKNFGGHGSALAQVYNHIIMPLATARDKRTQVVWGIRDFEHRFARKPEGMWLAETAVDIETLETLAAEGITFTILAPHQALRVRREGSDAWDDVSGARIDTRKPYLCRLPSSRSIALFFYNGPVSREIAFGNLLADGASFARRLAAGFTDATDPQLVHIATDGETYGHHHKYGDMALAYCFHLLQTENMARPTVYGEFLELSPPGDEVEIAENTAWSCAHGIERWRSDCGCETGCDPRLHQRWRAPLREAVDMLAERLGTHFESAASGLLRDPWAARDDYVSVLLDRSEDGRGRFLDRHAARKLDAENKVRGLKLLEMQRNSLLQFTSCGWFFDDVAGLETVQILMYAARAIQLAAETDGPDLEADFVRILERAAGNRPGLKSGAVVYRKLVKPAVVDMARVGAHYAVSTLFREYGETDRLSCYRVRKRALERLENGKRRMTVGRARLVSDMTGETLDFNFAALYRGDLDLQAGARACENGEAYETMSRELAASFRKGDAAETMRLMDKHFGTHGLSLHHLFRDEQRRIVNGMFGALDEDLSAEFRKIHDEHAALLEAAAEMGIPVSGALSAVMGFMHNRAVERLLRADVLDLERLEEEAGKAREGSFRLDTVRASFLLGGRLENHMAKLLIKPGNGSVAESAAADLEAARILGIELPLWKAQNLYFYAGKKSREKSVRIDLFNRLGDLLGVKAD